MSALLAAARARRFSVAWPRVIPEAPGAVSTPGLDFYDRLVDALLARGVTLVTLHHWDRPPPCNAVADGSAAHCEAFADYAEVLAQRLGDRVSGGSRTASHALSPTSVMPSACMRQG